MPSIPLVANEDYDDVPNLIGNFRYDDMPVLIVNRYDDLPVINELMCVHNNLIANRYDDLPLCGRLDCDVCGNDLPVRNELIYGFDNDVDDDDMPGLIANDDYDDVDDNDVDDDDMPDLIANDDHDTF
jgi:hypothetical protein